VLLAALAASAMPLALDSGQAASHAVRAAASPHAPDRVLGLSYAGNRGTLRWLDPRTLAPLGPRALDVGRYTGPAAFSPDGSTLVLGRWLDVAGLRFVDLATLRAKGGLGLQRGSVEAIAWLEPRRLLVLAAPQTSPEHTLYVVDPVARRLLRKVAVAGRLESARRAGSRLVLLLSPEGAIGAGALAVVDAEGSVRAATLSQTTVGTIFPEDGSDPIGTVRRAGLAVDPQGGRAFVVGAGEPVAEVDLATLAVSYHSLAHPSLLQRLLGWLEPAAQAKGLNGPLRDAVWLGDGLLAVAGSDEHTWVDSDGQWHEQRTPAGLQLVDTRDWRARTIQADATWCRVVAGLLQTTTGSADAGTLAVIAYDRTGAVRLRIDGAAGAGWLQAAGRYLYSHSGGTTTILDAATGAQLGQASTDVSLLAGDSIDQT
jgi:hypothetical protein